MVYQLTPAVQWRCCKKNGNYPYNHTVEPCHSLVRKNCAVQTTLIYRLKAIRPIFRVEAVHRAECLLFSGHLLQVQQSLYISVISRVIMRGRYESASTIGCPERTWMLINMM